MIAGGAELTGTRTGQYQWTGHLSYGEVIAFTSLAAGTPVATSISTADIGAASPTLTFTIPSSANAVGLTGTLSLDKATGVLTNGTNGGASTLRFQTADSAASKGAAIFAGRLHGPGGISLAGVFASTGTQIDDKNWAGAVIASGASDKLTRLAGGLFNGPQITGIPTIASGDYALANHSAAQEVYVVAPVGSGILFDANHASTVIRAGALVGNLVSSTGTNTALNAGVRVAGENPLTVHTRTSSATIGGAAHTVTFYQDLSESVGESAATLAVVGAASGGTPLALVAGGGNPGITATTAGTYNWAGLHLQGLANASDISTLARGRFELEITFTAADATASFSYLGGVAGGSSPSGFGHGDKGKTARS